MSSAHTNHVALFEAMRKRDRLPHAFLFTGPGGVGKRVFAHAVAQWLQKTEDSSLTTEEIKAHPDIVLLEAPSIAEVRKLRTLVATSPYSAPVRSVIIDRADEVGEEATNALLKTLEEPRSATFFFLLTAYPSRVLPTIASRCQSVPFGFVTQQPTPVNLALLGRPYREEQLWNEVLGDAHSFLEGGLSERFALIERYHAEGAPFSYFFESLMVCIKSEVGVAGGARALSALLDMSRRLATSNANSAWMMRSFAVRLPALLV